MDELVGALEGECPLFAVLGLIDVDELSEESTLSAMLGYELGAFLVGFLESEAVALVVAGQTLITPGGNLVHRDDARLFEGLSRVLFYLFVVLPVEGCLTESEITGGCTFLGKVFLLQLQGLEETLLGETHVARLFTDGAEGECGEVHADVAVVGLGVMVYVVSQLYTFLTVYVLKHIDGLVAAGAVVSLLIL